MLSAAGPHVHRNKRTLFVDGYPWEITTTWVEVIKPCPVPRIWAVETIVVGHEHYSELQNEIPDELFQRPHCQICAHE